jgi:hypothetical protein
MQPSTTKRYKSGVKRAQLHELPVAVATRINPISGTDLISHRKVQRK